MSKNANKPSSMLRIVIPLIAVLLGLLVVLSLMRPKDDAGTDKEADDQQLAQADPKPDGDKPDRPDDDDDTPKPDAPDDTNDGGDPDASGNDDGETPEPDTGTADGEPDGDPDDDSEAQAQADPLSNLRAVFADAPAALDEPDNLIDLGSNAPDGAYKLYAQINPYRAGIHRVALPNVKKTVSGDETYTLLEPVSYDRFDQAGEKTENYPEIGSYAARTLYLNGTPVSMARKDKDTGDWFGGWALESKSDDAVTLSLTIQGGPDDAPVDVAKVTRTFRIAPGSHTIELKQRIENLTDKPLKAKWEQLAQGDVHHETNDYLRGRSLHYVTGYFDDDYDEARFSIYVKDGFISRPDLIDDLKDPDDTGKWSSVWPNPKVKKEDKLLAWLASENRYFVAISSADVKPDIEETKDITPLEAVYPTINTTIYPDANADEEMPDDKRMVLIGFVSKELEIAPGKSSRSADLSLDLFVGPREDRIFAQAPYKAMRFERTIRYSLGGFCGVCTFQWLANLLLGFLELLHMAVFDWGIAIIILVLVVRICLHPLTKRGQTSMMLMGKQMAAIQPELNKLKKKFADDPRQMQQAQMQLFREKGINPAAGALGCLPMFLQMPIWIALYAMLYYAIELRHEPAFYGVFQGISNLIPNTGTWPFLADLSSADRFIPLMADDGTTIINLLFIQFNYSSINILPLLMGVTFFINMKFTTPPPMNEQQATQQKIMRIMPLLFPFFLYSAPAGLTLYICASTLAGIVDSYIVRKHVKEMEESGELFKPKKRKPGGFMDKLQKAAEMRAKQMEEAKKQQQQKNKGPQQYKKRRK